MNNTDKAFSAKERSLLGSLVGDNLIAVDACIVARGDMAWNTVRLHFSKISIDLNNNLGKIVVDEFGTLDEFGLMGIAEADPGILDIPEVSSDTTVIPVGKEVRSVRVVNDIIRIYGKGEAVTQIRYPQAVILDFDDESLVFDKEAWFDETISVKAGRDIASLVYDDTVNWADDPEEDPATHYEAGIEIERL